MDSETGIMNLLEDFLSVRVTDLEPFPPFNTKIKIKISRAAKIYKR